MMGLGFILGVVRITNVLIAIFILFYAFMFLIKTSRRQERKPWDYLFMSALIFFLYQLFSLIFFFMAGGQVPPDANVYKIFLEFLFSGLVLLAFVSQHDLILKSPLILISRKVDEEKK